MDSSSQTKKGNIVWLSKQDYIHVTKIQTEKSSFHLQLEADPNCGSHIVLRLKGEYISNTPKIQLTKLYETVSQLSKKKEEFTEFLLQELVQKFGPI